MARAQQTVEVHPERKEIARYLLSRGFEQLEELGDAAAPVRDLGVGTRAGPGFTFPQGLAPVPKPVSPAPDPTRSLPRADVVVITWTVDELAALGEGRRAG